MTKPETTVEARRIEGQDGGDTLQPGEFTYVLLPPHKLARKRSDRRDSPRQRTRLRSGKIADAKDGRFVTECLVYDLSVSGSRVRHPIGAVLPSPLYLFDDQTGALHLAVVLWRRRHESGIGFRVHPVSARSRAIASELRRKFYAVQT